MPLIYLAPADISSFILSLDSPSFTFCSLHLGLFMFISSIWGQPFSFLHIVISQWKALKCYMTDRAWRLQQSIYINEHCNQVNPYPFQVWKAGRLSLKYNTSSPLIDCEVCLIGLMILMLDLQLLKTVSSFYSALCNVVRLLNSHCRLRLCSDFQSGDKGIFRTSSILYDPVTNHPRLLYADI